MNIKKYYAVFLPIFIWRYRSRGTYLSSEHCYAHYIALAALPNSIDCSRATRVINQTQASRSPGRQATLHSTGRYQLQEVHESPPDYSPPRSMLGRQVQQIQSIVMFSWTAHKTSAVYRGGIIKTFVINDKLLPMLILWPWKRVLKQQHIIYVKCEYFTNQNR